MEKDLINIKKYCEKSNVDSEFIKLLEEEYLIEVNNIDGIDYVASSQFTRIEMFSRMYYDLSINIEGIDAINNLLEKVLLLKKEIQSLKNKLGVYESDEDFFIEF